MLYVGMRNQVRVIDLNGTKVTVYGPNSERPGLLIEWGNNVIGVPIPRSRKQAAFVDIDGQVITFHVGGREDRVGFGVPDNCPVWNPHRRQREAV